MRVSILQPTYWARTHVWNRVLSSDVFIWLDHVKFSRSSTKWEDRTIVEGRDQRATVLRLPLKGPRTVSWDEAGLNDGWLDHRRTVQMCYGRSEHWDIVREMLANVYEPGARTINEVCRRTFDQVREYLGVRAEIVSSRELGPSSSKGQLVLDLVHAVGGTSYISGAPGLSYLPLDKFAEAGVEVVVQDWPAPETRGGLVNPSVLHVVAHYTRDDVIRILS